MPRDVPQYVSQLMTGSVGQVPSGMGLQAQAQTAQRVSQQATAVATDMFEKSNRITELSAITDLRENLHRISEEAGADPATLKAKADGFVKGWVKNVGAPGLAEKLELQARNEMIPYLDKATTKYNHNLDIEQEAVVLRAQKQNISTIGAISPNLYSHIPEQREGAQKALASIFDEAAMNATLKKSDGTYMFSPEQQLAMAADVQKELVVTLPPEKRLQALGAGAGGFEEAMTSVFNNEGGYSSSDGGTGVPVNFGINQDAHKDVNVATLTKEQAAAIYKRDYWDAHKLGELRPDQQAIVMDGVVNHEWMFKNRLVDAAKKGASPSELIEMRRKEYDRLAATGRYPDSVVTSWEKRLASFEHFTIGENLNLIPSSLREQLKESTMKELEVELRLKADDPAKWGQRRGLNTLQIVQMQGDPVTASVLPKEAAKTIAARAEEFNSADDIVALAGELSGQYQEFAPNALNDLMKQKLPLAQATALNLAMKDPSGNMDRIRILHEISKAGSDGINKAYKEITGDDPKAVIDSVFSEHEDYIRAVSVEGSSIAQIEKSMDLTASVAKAYKIKNPDVNINDAINYALSQDVERYKVAEINGSKFRVPTHDRTGMVIDLDAVESRVEEALAAMPDDSFSVSAADSALARAAREPIAKLVKPYLNETSDGVKFRTPAGDVLRNKDGSPVQFTFKDVISFPTKSELGREIKGEISIPKIGGATPSSIDFTKSPQNLAN